MNELRREGESLVPTCVEGASSPVVVRSGVPRGSAARAHLRRGDELRSSQRGVTRRGVMARVLMLAGLATAVAACGRRPESLLPPEEADETRFPRTYPPQ